MLVSPFTLYRGAALLLAADLAQGPPTGLTVQLCGDAYLCNVNFVRVAGAATRLRRQRLRRDQPRALRAGREEARRRPGDCGQDNGHSAKQRRATVTAKVRAYRLTIRELAGQPNIGVWHAHQAIDPTTLG